MKKLYNRYLKNNLGLLNLFGKASGRVLFLLLTSFFAYQLSIEDFAVFALFWTTIRMLTYVSANNYYIIYFNEVRKSLIEEKKWSLKTTANIGITGLVFGLISTAIAYHIFKDIRITLLFFPSLLLFVAIRSLSEFSKADNSVVLAIFIEDFLFYFLFFIFGIAGIFISNNINSIVIALFLALVITFIFCYILFIKKFKLDSIPLRLNWAYFSAKDFRLGVNYTFFRGNEFFANFGVRYFGLVYFGELFVSYSHIMYQFYNIFLLITISVISGLQSRITLHDNMVFNTSFVKKSYKNILKIAAPFTVIIIISIYFFKDLILEIFFPKYVAYADLLMKVSLIGLLLMLIQPLVYILIYNKKMLNIHSVNIVQYATMILLFISPSLFMDFSEEIWLLLAMSAFVLVQGLFSVVTIRKTL